MKTEYMITWIDLKTWEEKNEYYRNKREARKAIQELKVYGHLIRRVERVQNVSKEFNI